MTSNRHPAGQSDGSGNLAAIVAADRAFPAAVELGSLAVITLAQQQRETRKETK
jgi:hypothetical protein